MNDAAEIKLEELMKYLRVAIVMEDSKDKREFALNLLMKLMKD